MVTPTMSFWTAAKQGPARLGRKRRGSSDGATPIEYSCSYSAFHELTLNVSPNSEGGAGYGHCNSLLSPFNVIRDRLPPHDGVSFGTRRICESGLPCWPRKRGQGRYRHRRRNISQRDGLRQLHVGRGGMVFRSRRPGGTSATLTEKTTSHGSSWQFWTVCAASSVGRRYAPASKHSGDGNDVGFLMISVGS